MNRAEPFRQGMTDQIAQRRRLIRVITFRSVERQTSKHSLDRRQRFYLEYVNVQVDMIFPFRKHVYWNALKIWPTKNWTFSDKSSDTFYISAQNIDLGSR